MITFTIKKRSDSGQWQHIPVGDFAGKTVKQLFLQLDGGEYVAEFEIDGKRCFLCGTDHWIERMKQKGPAVSFSYAITRLQDTRPELLEEIIPEDLLTALASEFGGTVEMVKLGQEVC